MTVIVDLQNACSDEVPNIAQFQQWVEVALDKEGSISSDCELSIRLVDEVESAELNSSYRDKVGPTNVLSFPFDSLIPMEPRLLGDLVICTSVVEKEALAQNKAQQAHWAHMVVHGCLHLLAYDHIEDDEAEVMEALEVTILKSLLINDPYQDQGDIDE
ncbi:MAG: rRNA maturation RNase YbeY [Methylophaga sp.]|nr:rRNA maturation RNase YbeY [Methylophaga sp.]